MRIVVLGGGGMLGHKVFQILRERFPGTLCTVRTEIKKSPLAKVAILQGNDVISGVDVSDFSSLQGVLADLKPDYIINCIGVIKQRDQARMAIPSITINALLPHKLAAFAESWGGRVIHPSTDCVFDGRRGQYTEEDRCTAEDLYGQSKFLGELHYLNALTVRTSIVGRELTEHRSLLDWFLAQRGKTIRGFRRVLYSGITTNQFADVVTMIIQRYPALHGLYQVASEPITKHDLLKLFRDAYQMPVTIVPDDQEISDRTMKGDKFRQATGYQAPSWPEMVNRLASDPTPYADWAV